MTVKLPPLLNIPTNSADFAIGRWTGVSDDFTATGIFYPPRPIQRKRTKGWRMPPNTVYVGRGSPWGNPFKPGDHWRVGAARIPTGNVAFNTQMLKAFGDRPLTQADCVAAYIIYLDYAGIPSREGWWPEPKDLKGRNLACWCGLDQPCHRAVLLERSNQAKP